MGLPVRVVRRAELDSRYAPAAGYRYDGLYYVDDSWSEDGRSGFKVWRYRLVKESDAHVPIRGTVSEPTDRRPKRVESTVQRLVRDAKQSRRLKELYDYTCQVCGIRLATPFGAYAEGAHIRPLGEPHNGSDSSDNLLSLCPNHHVLFDLGAISLNDDLALIGLPGRLSQHPQHKLNTENLRYHREHYWNSNRMTHGTMEESARSRGNGEP